jgi:hypothetical protein
MRYGLPSYEVAELLCALATQKQHYSLYVMDTKLVEQFRPQLGKLQAERREPHTGSRDVGPDSRC